MQSLLDGKNGHKFLSSHQERRCFFSLWILIGHVICIDQLDISKCDAVRGLKNTWPFWPAHQLSWEPWDHHMIRHKLACWRMEGHMEENQYTPGRTPANRRPDPAANLPTTRPVGRPFQIIQQPCQLTHRRASHDQLCQPRPELDNSQNYELNKMASVLSHSVMVWFFYTTKDNQYTVLRHFLWHF